MPKTDFETSLNKLESIVNQLEEGEMNLDDSIKSFEQGIKLYKDCKVVLEKAEKKIQVLTDSLKEEEYSEE
jgi:exodeoxyribonuclease VII small subunit